MKRCRNIYPNKSAVICDRPPGPHKLCSGFDDDLDEYVDWPNPAYVEAKATDATQARHAATKLASRVPAREPSHSSHRWTATEQLQVRTAILALAQERETFTADDVWDLLGESVPKTAGLTALLREAVKERYITPTDLYADSTRSDRTDHDHGRRLRVWRSLYQG